MHWNLKIKVFFLYIKIHCLPAFVIVILICKIKRVEQSQLFHQGSEKSLRIFTRYLLWAECSYKAFDTLKNQWKIIMFSYFFKGVTKARQNLSALLIFKFSPDALRIPRKNIRFHSKPGIFKPILCKDMAKIAKTMYLPFLLLAGDPSWQPKQLQAQSLPHSLNWCINLLIE